MISPRWLVFASAVAPVGFLIGLGLVPELSASSGAVEYARSQDQSSILEEGRSWWDSEKPQGEVVQVRIEVRERRTHLERDEYVRQVRVRRVERVGGPQCPLL